MPDLPTIKAEDIETKIDALLSDEELAKILHAARKRGHTAAQTMQVFIDQRIKSVAFTILNAEAFEYTYPAWKAGKVFALDSVIDAFFAAKTKIMEIVAKDDREKAEYDFAFDILQQRVFMPLAVEAGGGQLYAQKFRDAETNYAKNQSVSPPPP